MVHTWWLLGHLPACFAAHAPAGLVARAGAALMAGPGAGAAWLSTAAVGDRLPVLGTSGYLV